MVQFTKVRLSGFKSFADKTVIDFSVPVVGIVGHQALGNMVEDNEADLVSGLDGIQPLWLFLHDEGDFIVFPINRGGNRLCRCCRQRAGNDRQQQGQ